MNDWEFSAIEIISHSEKGIPLFMTWENYSMLQDFIIPVTDN
jgi:hypothetical protein